MQEYFPNDLRFANKYRHKKNTIRGSHLCSGAEDVVLTGSGNSTRANETLRIRNLASQQLKAWNPRK